MILGTIIAARTNPRELTSILRPEMFDGVFRDLAEQVWQMVESYNAVDVVKVAQGTVFSPSELVNITNSAISYREAAIETLQDFFNEYVAKRTGELFLKCSEKVRKGARPSEVVSEFSHDFQALASNTGFEDKRMAQGIEVIKDIERVMNVKDGVVGMPTGYTVMDKFTGGWHKTDLNIIAGRPGMGKTTFALCCSWRAARLGVPVGIISLEMSTKQLRKKLISIETGISYSDIRRGKLTENDFLAVSEVVEQMSEMPIHIEHPASDFEEVLNTMYLMKEKFGCEIFVIDYLQLMRLNGYRNNRNGEVEEMSRRLKESASENKLDSCMICLSQLSRAVEIRGGSKRPQMSDLRDSGAIEQDADSITFIYRPEYYQLTTTEDDQDTTNLVEIIYEKNRHGEVGTIPMRRADNFSDIFEPGSEKEFEQLAQASAESATITPGHRVSETIDHDVPF